MINLCNDVLNKDRRNMFPKINTLTNKLSLYSLIFLRQQDPYKFYKSFYDKIVKNSSKDMNKINIQITKSNSLSLLSKTQNHFYCVPIKYNHRIDNTPLKSNIIFKYNTKGNNIKTRNKNKSTTQRENSNANHKTNNLNIINNNNLQKVHLFLLKNKIEKNNQAKLKKKKKSKSCIDIFIANNIKDNEYEYNNSIIYEKISRGQQTISSGENEKNDKVKQKNKGIDVYKNKKKEENKIPKMQKKKKHTFSFFTSNNTKNNNNNNINEIKVIWRNLRRPIKFKYNL
jgi:hypothetical protein